MILNCRGSKIEINDDIIKCASEDGFIRTNIELGAKEIYINCRNEIMHDLLDLLPEDETENEILHKMSMFLGFTGITLKSKIIDFKPIGKTRVINAYLSYIVLFFIKQVSYLIESSAWPNNLDVLEDDYRSIMPNNCRVNFTIYNDLIFINNGLENLRHVVMDIDVKDIEVYNNFISKISKIRKEFMKSDKITKLKEKKNDGSKELLKIYYSYVAN
jgi:hypothetical protein